MPPHHQSILIQMHNNPMPWFLHINLGFKCYINLSFRRSFTFYNNLMCNKIRWCKICPNLLWMMRPNVVELVGHISSLRFSCTFSFTFCWISLIASMQPTRIDWLDCKHHKILKSSQKSFEHWFWSPFWIL